MISIIGNDMIIELIGFLDILKIIQENTKIHNQELLHPINHLRPKLNFILLLKLQLNTSRRKCLMEM